MNFRIKFQIIEPPIASPTLILLSTDGYANSFRDDAGFLKTGSDLFEMLNVGKGSESVAMIANSMEDWLAETSKKGSGDDVTMGILCRLDAFEKSKQ